MLIHRLLTHVLREPAGDDGADLSKADRGDDFKPTEDDKDDDKVEITDDDKKAVGLRDKDDDDDEETDPDEEKNPDEEKEEKAEEKKGAKKDTRIPLKRHQELLAKEREAREVLERQLAASKKAETLQVTNERITAAEEKLLAAEKEYNDLLVDGKAAEATAKMREIRALEREIGTAKTTMEVQAAEARAYDRVRYDMTVERIEAAYPALNQDHDDFDKEKTAEVMELFHGYVATGKYDRAGALQKAVKVLLGSATTRQNAATETDVRVNKDDVAEQVRKQRAAEQRRKNAEAADKQPPDASKVGKDHDKLGGKLTADKVMKMKQDEFAKLTEADIAALRGDEI